MQDRVYQTPVRDMTDLMQRLIDAWNGLSQSVALDGAIDGIRVQASVDKKGSQLNTCCDI